MLASVIQSLALAPFSLASPTRSPSAVPLARSPPPLRSRTRPARAIAGGLWPPPEDGGDSKAVSGLLRLVSGQTVSDDELFDSYDADSGGTIDREEFKEIARTMRTDATRRTILAAFSSAAAAAAVAKYSEEYAFVQKYSRGLFIESEAERAMNNAFPTAMLSSDANEAIAKVLQSRGFTADNSLFAHSVCPDEVNAKSEELVSLLIRQWGEAFTLGGLGGVPFAGKTGVRAYLHHVPDRGRLVIFFAPHVGIDSRGKVGGLQRFGQTSFAVACGAAVGAYKALKGKSSAAVEELQRMGSLTNDDQGFSPFDPEIKYIKQKLGPRLAGLREQLAAAATGEQPLETDTYLYNLELSFVTYQMYEIVRDLLYKELRDTEDLWDYATEVALVGGILINRDTGGDFFQPMRLEVHSRFGTESEDLYETAFGPRPDLSRVLGSKEEAEKLRRYTTFGEFARQTV